MVKVAIWSEDPVRDDEMPVWMEAQVGGKAVLTHQYFGLESLLKFTLSIHILAP
jgi:hypothetical protein